MPIITICICIFVFYLCTGVLIKIERLNAMKVKIKLLSPDAKMPQKQHSSDAGFDLFSTRDAIFSWHGQTEVIDCMFSIELPEGYEAQIRPRSGLAINTGITVINSPGTVDSGFLGSVKVGLVMASWCSGKYSVKKGDRIAQMVIQKLPEIELEETDYIRETDRGDNGFGSTGL